MENKKTTPKSPSKQKTTAKKKPADTSNEKIAQLTASVDTISLELENLKSTLQKSKSENIAFSTEIENLKSGIQQGKSENAAISSELENLKLNVQKEKNENTPLTTSANEISAELETLKLNIQKRKSENTTLKILFYTGLIVLLLGFLYTNSTLQRAQMDSMESSIQLMRNLMNKELLSVEKNVYQKIDLLEKDAGEKSKVSLQEALETMTLAISRLDTGDEKTTVLIEQVRKNSMELRDAVSEHEQSRQRNSN